MDRTNSLVPGCSLRLRCFVASRSATRKRECELTIAIDERDGPIVYSGPELRQEDGLIFMALVNSVRDIRLGSVAEFVPADLCRAVFNHYDGRARCA